MAQATHREAQVHEVPVLGTTMAYREVGAGTPIVLLHGNPSSSYGWRHVLPVVGTAGRALAPDLIGMGDSGRPDIAYSFADHARHLDAWFDALGLDDVVLVGHDWGGALAFDHARRHPGRVRGVAFLETIVRPFSAAEFPPGHPFHRLRTPGLGEQLVLDEDFFMTTGIHATTLGTLADEDVAAYRRPFPTPASRRALLAWPRSMPIAGEPADVVATVEASGEWLATSPDVPKLLLTFTGSPTLVIGDEVEAWCRAHVAALEVEACGPSGHLAVEDRPEAIAAAVVSWLARHGLAAAGPGTAGG